MLNIGDDAPPFDLPGIPEQSYRLADLRGEFVVLYFYPKDDTPGCTTEACDFRDHWKRIQESGAVVWGISADSAARHARFAGKYELPFPLLSDVDHAVCEKYGVWQEKRNYGRTYMGIQRATFLVNPAGKIAAVWPKVSVKGHVESVLDELTRQTSDSKA